MRSAGSSEERSSPLEYLVPLVLAGLAAIPAWYFGGVSETRFFWPPVLFAASVWIALVGLQLAPRAAMPAALLPLALVFAWVLFQLTPLSPRTLAWWSPTAAAAWSEADGGGGAESGSAGGARRTISLFPEGTREEAALLFLGFAVFALAAHFLRSDRMLPLLFVSTAASGAALGLFAIVQKMQNARKLYFEVDLSMGGVFYGPFVNRNHCAAYLAMCLAGAVAMLAWLDARRRRKEREALRQAGPQAAFFPEAEGWRQQALESFRGFGPWHLTFLFGAAAIGAALMASGSRGAILSAALAAAAVALAWRIPQPDPDDDAERGRSSGFVLAIAAALGAVALAAWTGLDQQAFDRLGSLGDEGDAGQAYRALHWREMAAAIPVFAKAGSGLGTYAVVSPGFTPNNRGRTFEHAENSYLEAIVELGIPGAILLLVTLLLLLRATALLLFNDGGRESRIFALAATFVLISQAAHAAVDFALLSPANLILFAAWMGAAAGRAARLERARAKSGRTPARFISLPASGSAGLAGGGAALILAGGYAAWRSAARLEGLEAALRADRLLKTTADANPEEVDEAIALLQTEAAHSPQHPIVRSRLGERLIDRYRLAAYATFKKAAPATPPEQLWDRTDLGELYGHVMRLERARRPADLDALRAEPAVAANLAPAKEELEAAARYGPLLPWPRIRLAQLAYLGDSSARQRRLLDAAQRMAPGDSEIAYRCGLVDYYANRPERALASWRRSLEIEHKFFAPIFLSSHRWLGIRTTLDEALPPDAALLVRIADSYFGQNSKTPEPARSADRGEILRQALAALPKMPKGAAKAKTAALLYTLGNEPKLAEESFEEAISLAPHDWNMRLRYASLLESEKRYADAARQAEIAYNLSSRNPTVGEHLARLERLAARGRGP